MQLSVINQPSNNLMIITQPGAAIYITRRNVRVVMNNHTCSNYTPPNKEVL